MKRNLGYFLVAFIMLTPVSSLNAQWLQTDGPYGGNTTSLCADSSGAVYAVSYPSGKNNTYTPSVYKSLDHGDSWAIMDSALKGYAPCLVFVDSQNDLYVGCSNRSGFDGTGGLFRSTNGGESWSLVLPDKAISSMVSGQKGAIYVAADDSLYWSRDNGSSWNSLINPEPYNALSIAVNSSGNIFVSGYEGVYRSTNSGTSWQNLPFLGWRELALDKRGNLFCVADSVWKSTDNGDTWSSLSTDIVPYQNWQTISVDESGDIFVGAEVNGEIIKSTDDGSSWQLLNNANWSPSYAIWSIFADRDGHIFVGDVDGIYRSSDAGSSWIRSCNGIKEVPVISLASTKTGLLFAGTWGSCVFRSDDGGQSWVQSSVGLTNANAAVLAVDSSQNVYVGTPGQGVFKSTNEGDSWSPVNTGLVGYPGDPDLDAEGMVVDSHNNLFVNLIGSNIFRSSDFGNTWHSTNFPSQFNSNVMFVPPNEVLAGTNEGVYGSTDEGASWNLTSVPNLLLASACSDILWAIDSQAGVLKSTDEGATWEQMSPGFSEYDTWCVVADSLSDLFAGTDSGVYRSTGGSHWSSFSSGLPNLYARSMIIAPDGHAYVGTGRGGVSRTITKTTSVNNLVNEFPNRYTLSQNYPNPFNPTTTITYQLPSPSRVILKIYDVLGREVRTLINERQTTGSHSVTFDGSNLPSGVYFYKLQAGSYTETKKLVLLK